MFYVQGKFSFFKSGGGGGLSPSPPSYAPFTGEILKGYIKDCFKINGKQRIKMSKKGEYVKFKLLFPFYYVRTRQIES